MTTAAELITILRSVNVEDSQQVVGYLLFLFVFRRPLFFFLLVSFSSAANHWWSMFSSPFVSSSRLSFQKKKHTFVAA